MTMGWMTKTYLENRFRMRPAGVVSKKLIGERKIAKAIRSCSFRLACMQHQLLQARMQRNRDTHLDRTKDPQDERLHNYKCSRSHAESEVDTDVFAHMRVAAESLVDL
jgi:hypothetical protein